MPSAIDPTKPASGVPASKEDLRTNLLAARTELEHGGFAEGFAPTNYGPVANARVLTHLQEIDEALGSVGGSISWQDEGGTPFAATNINVVGAGGSISNLGGGNAQLSLTAGGSGSTWVNVKDAFGAVGNGVADDTTTLQNAINSNLPLYLPPGTYLITSPLLYNSNVYMRGAGGNGPFGPQTTITGNFAAPLMYRWSAGENAGGYVDHNDQWVGSPAIGVAIGFMLEDIVFSNQHVNGSCVQTINLRAPIVASRCTFGFNFRGLILGQTFGALVENCYFNSSSAPARILDGTDLKAVGLYLGGHCTAVGCDFQGCGTGIRAVGPQSNVYSARMEICGVGMQLGGISLSAEQAGVNWALNRSMIAGISMEANNRGLLISNISASTEVRDIGIQGGTNGPSGDGIGEYGILIGTVGDKSCKVSGLSAGGYFKQGAILLEAAGGGGAIDSLNGWNLQSGRPGYGGLGIIFDQHGSGAQGYNLRRFPLNPSLNDAQPAGHDTVTVFSDMQLRGIKGLDIANQNVLPNNLGRIESVPQSATTHAVAFSTAVDPAHAGMSSLSAVTAPSSLPAGSYVYTSTLIGPRGETGVNPAQQTKTVSISSGQIARVALFGVSNQPRLKRRIYRRLGTVADRYDGFFEIPVGQTTFDDTGTVAFTGNDRPPPDGYSIPAETELDANYAVVVTPSWNSSVWITAKAPTGFTINFGTAVPAGATVQWLLFRP